MEIQGLKDCGSYHRAKIKQYIDRMTEPDTRVLFDDRVAEILEEQGFAWQEDPRSIYEPQQLWDALERYSPIHSKFIDVDDLHLKKGIDVAWKVFARKSERPHLSPLSDVDLLYKALKPTKSSGLPNLVSKKEDYVYALDREKQVRAGIKAPSPCLAGKRTQANNKTRLVWMYPLEMTLMEARFARPLIQEFLGSRTTMAFGMSKVELGAIVDSICYQLDGSPVALDYSKFDSSIPQYLIKVAFNILKTWFTPEELDEFGWREVENYFIYTPIVMIDGHLYRGKKHGVPSGSYFTQLIDSIVNTILVMSLASKFQLKMKWTQFLVLGDDVICNIKDPKTDEYAEYLSTFGITMNVEKTDVKAHFLGADWYHGKPFRDLNELKARAIYPETFRKYDINIQPKLQARSILVSLMTQYYNAWRLLDKQYKDVRMMDTHNEIIRTDFMSGSDRYINEEVAIFKRPMNYHPTVAERSLK